MAGFKPAGSPNVNWGFQPASGSPGVVAEGDDYLDDEERERVQRVQQETEERKEKLYTKQLEEEDLKRERKAHGREELAKWTQQRQKETELRRNTNNESERMYHENVQA